MKKDKGLDTSRKLSDIKNFDKNFFNEENSETFIGIIKHLSKC